MTEYIPNRIEAAAKAQMLFDDLKILRSNGGFSRAHIEVCECGEPQYSVFEGDVEIQLETTRRDPGDKWAEYRERETLQDAIREYDASAGIKSMPLEEGIELTLTAIS